MLAFVTLYEAIAHSEIERSDLFYVFRLIAHLFK